MTLLAPRLPFAPAAQIRWGQLYGAAASLAIAEAAPAANGPLLVIAPNSRDAESLCDEIAFFAADGLRVQVFPDFETLPYDGFSAHPDITSARLATLAALPRSGRGIWIVAVETLLQRLAPRSYIEAYSLRVHVGEALDLEALRARLTAAGYAAVTQVVAHGEFAVRGSLLDVFPMGSDSPLRIDLLDRDVDSIRRFDPDSQRSRRQARTHRTAARTGNPAASGCDPRVPPALPPALSRRPVRARDLPRRERRGSPRAASSITCRCSSNAPRICSSTCRRPA